MEKCFPYSILTKKQQLLQAVTGGAGIESVVKTQAPPAPPPPGQSIAANYLSALLPMPGAKTCGTQDIRNFESSVDVNGFYGNAMVTDVGICFSMSNVNLNGHPPTMPLPPGMAAAAALPETCPSQPAASQARLTTTPRYSTLGRRKSYEDPGPETALVNARRRATECVSVMAEAHFASGTMMDVHVNNNHEHRQQQPPSFFPVPPMHPVAQHGTIATATPHQQLPSVHQVHQALPRQRSHALTTGRSAYGIVRSTSSDRVRGTGSALNNASTGSVFGGTLGVGAVRSSPPYFKQIPSGGCSKPSAVANFFQQPTASASAASTLISAPQYGSVVNHQLPSTPAVTLGHAATSAYHHQGALQYLPLSNALPLAGTPPTAAYEYYRYAIEATESAAKMQSPSPAILPGNNIVGPASDEGGMTAPPVGPVMDYNGLRQLFLKCCYNEMKTLPSATAASGGTILATDVSAPVSTATSLSADSPNNCYEFNAEDSPAGTQPVGYAPSGVHYPLVCRSCPSSPNGPHCHALVSPATGSSACSTPLGGGQGSIIKRDDRFVSSEAEEVRPMEVCGEESEVYEGSTTITDGADADDADDEPKDFSMKTIAQKESVTGDGRRWPLVDSDSAVAKQDDDVGAQRRSELVDDRSKKELKTAPKKKWIRHYMKGKVCDTIVKQIINYDFLRSL